MPEKQGDTCGGEASSAVYAEGIVQQEKRRPGFFNLISVHFS
jgi:hypothetical protein